MATNFRNKMLESTANLPSLNEIQERNKGKKEKNEAVATIPKRPQTAVGAMGALAAAESKLQELQSRADPKKIPVNRIKPNPWQPRRVFDADAMEALEASIVEIGLVQPIVVRHDPNQEGGFQLIAGERRWRAHKSLGISDITAWAIDLSNEDMAIWALTENIAREDLSDYEIYRSIEKVLNEETSRKNLAESLGISRTQFYRYLSFGKLPNLVLESLDEDPYLLGSNAAYDLQRVLSQLGEDGEKALHAIWPDFLEGRIHQLKLPEVVQREVKGGASKDEPKPRVTQLLQKGKVAGHIKRDAKSLTIKINTDDLNEEVEAKLLEALETLYQTEESK